MLRRVVGAIWLALIATSAAAQDQDASAAVATTDVRWIGHERVVAAAEARGELLTLGADGLVIAWRDEQPVRWTTLPGAEHVVANGAGWRVLAADQGWVLDASLNVLETQTGVRGVTTCQGDALIWWWVESVLHVDGRLGSGSLAGVEAPPVTPRCSITSDHAALAWYDDAHAVVAAFDGAETSSNRVPYEASGDPVAVPASAGWDVAPRVGERIRACDTFFDDGRPRACRLPAPDAAFAELPRALPVQWIARDAQRLTAADVTGWTVLTRNGGRRIAPDGWRTYGLLGADAVVGCRVAAGRATVEMRDAGGNLRDDATIPAGTCPAFAWVDGERAAVTTSDAVLDWDGAARTWRVRPRGDAVFTTASRGPAGTRYEIRNAWSPACGDHRELWQVSVGHEARLRAGVACGTWTRLEPTWSDDGVAVIAEGVRHVVTGGDDDERVCVATEHAQPLAPECDGSVTLPGGAALVATTHGPHLRGPDGFWASGDLRRFAVLVDDAPRTGSALPRAPGWWRDAPNRVLLSR